MSVAEAGENAEGASCRQTSKEHLPCQLPGIAGLDNYHQLKMALILLSSNFIKFAFKVIYVWEMAIKWK